MSKCPDCGNRYCYTSLGYSSLKKDGFYKVITCKCGNVRHNFESDEIYEKHKEACATMNKKQNEIIDNHLFRRGK